MKYMVRSSVFEFDMTSDMRSCRDLVKTEEKGLRFEALDSSHAILGDVLVCHYEKRLEEYVIVCFT